MSMEGSALEALLLEVRDRLARIEERLKPDPTCLTYPAAAERLGVGVTKLKQMVKSGELQTSRVGRVPMVPMSEIHRVSAPSVAASNSRPRRVSASGTQDPAALRSRRR